MSIPEAVRLVLHSGAIGHSGDLCILDMGEQVRIVDLAENMIRMTGKVPYDEIDIQFTGIRAGEELYEELLALLAFRGVGARLCFPSHMPGKLVDVVDQDRLVSNHPSDGLDDLC